MSVEEWRVFAKGSAIKRAKRRGFPRNVAVVLGNRGDPASVPALAAALPDEEPLVGGHAAWALGRIASSAAVKALLGQVDVEAVAGVLEELRAALASATSRSGLRSK